MVKVWVLIIILAAGADGGRMVHSGLRFETKKECSEVLDALKKVRMGYGDNTLMCVEVVK